MRRTNQSLAAQNLPPEFKFSPTKMYYSAPPRNVIYEDAMGSSGAAPIDPELERQLDPIHWQSGRSPIENMRRTTQGVVSQMTHHLRHEGARKQTRVHKLHRETVNLHIEEPKGARRPRLRGYRTPEEVARGAKLKKTYDAKPDLEKILDITSSRRGFTSASRRSYAMLLAQGKAETIETLSAQLKRSDARKSEPRIRLGGAEYTRGQIATMPPGYIEEIIRRRTKRDAQPVLPRVRFDPRESKGRSPHGQVTTMYRPGLIPMGDGTYAHPASRGATYTSAILPDEHRLGGFGQTASGDLKGSLGIAAALLAGLAGMALLLSTTGKK